MTVAHKRESKFFLSQTPVSGSQNLHPKRFIPRMLQSSKIKVMYYVCIGFLFFNSHLKMKMKRASNPKNTATLSMVLSITISCLLRFGRNLTSLRILRSLKVLRTESPEPSSVTPYMMPLYSSMALDTSP